MVNTIIKNQDKNFNRYLSNGQNGFFNLSWIWTNSCFPTQNEFLKIYLKT